MCGNSQNPRLQQQPVETTCRAGTKLDPEPIVRCYLLSFCEDFLERCELVMSNCGKLMASPEELLVFLSQSGLHVKLLEVGGSRQKSVSGWLFTYLSVAFVGTSLDLSEIMSHPHAHTITFSKFHKTWNG